MNDMPFHLLLGRKLKHYMRCHYAAEIVADDSLRWRGHHPDLPGCEATADSPRALYEALEVARRDWIRNRLAQGLPVPAPNAHRPLGAPSKRMTA